MKIRRVQEFEWSATFLRLISKKRHGGGMMVWPGLDYSPPKLPEPHNQETYDLFIGEVIGAWSDTRVFSDGHWHFENADKALRSIHYIAGGHFYAIGDSHVVTE